MIRVHDAGAGELFAAHRAMVLETFHSTRFPWHRLLAGTLEFRGLDVSLVGPSDLGGLAGRSFPAGRIEIAARTIAGTGWTFLHEAGHVVDSRTLSGAVRARIIEAMGLDPADGWQRRTADYRARPVEGFAICWSRDVRPAHWPDPGPLSPEPANLEPGEALRWSLVEALEPWADLADEPGAVREAVAELADRGITRGTGLGVWSPAEPVTRRDMALFLTRTLEALEWRARE